MSSTPDNNSLEPTAFTVTDSDGAGCSGSWQVRQVYGSLTAVGKAASCPHLTHFIGFMFIFCLSAVVQFGTLDHLSQLFVKPSRKSTPASHPHGSPGSSWSKCEAGSPGEKCLQIMQARFAGFQLHISSCRTIRLRTVSTLRPQFQEQA
jgi:hypothetical protein